MVTSVPLDSMSDPLIQVVNTGAVVSSAMVQVKPLPDDGSTNSFYSSGAEMWYNSQQYIEVDMWGTNLPASFTMQHVEIIGQRLEADWTFPDIPVSFNSYLGVYGGGGGAAVPPCADAGSNKINWSKIEVLEGNRVEGYVPLKDGVPFAKSGVTIASGFDLGARNLSDLNSLNLSSSLVAKFTQYLGMKGSTAYNYEIANPLIITAAEALVINTATQTLGRVVIAYDNATQAGAFYSLPIEAQTVIASVAFQYGNLAKETPNFWSQIISKDWTAAEANLRDFKDAFVTRRTTEANYLAIAKDSGRLHDGSLC